MIADPNPAVFVPRVLFNPQVRPPPSLCGSGLPPPSLCGSGSTAFASKEKEKAKGKRGGKRGGKREGNGLSFLLKRFATLKGLCHEYFIAIDRKLSLMFSQVFVPHVRIVLISFRRKVFDLIFEEFVSKLKSLCARLLHNFSELWELALSHVEEIVGIVIAYVCGIFGLLVSEFWRSYNLAFHPDEEEKESFGLIFTKGDLKDLYKVRNFPMKIFKQDELAFLAKLGSTPFSILLDLKAGAPARVGLVAAIDPSQTYFFQVLNMINKVGSAEADKVGSAEADKD